MLQFLGGLAIRAPRRVLAGGGRVRDRRRGLRAPDARAARPRLQRLRRRGKREPPRGAGGRGRVRALRRRRRCSCSSAGRPTSGWRAVAAAIRSEPAFPGGRRRAPLAGRHRGAPLRVREGRRVAARLARRRAARRRAVSARIEGVAMGGAALATAQVTQPDPGRPAFAEEHRVPAALPPRRSGSSAASSPRCCRSSAARSRSSAGCSCCACSISRCPSRRTR